MKNYLFYFEFFSGLFESYFYKDIRADDEKDAITQVVSYCLNIQEEEAVEHLENELGEDWSTTDFWEKANTQFDNGSEAYSLIWIEEFDINSQLVKRYG